MLLKCVDRQTEWDQLLKYLLFAYRTTPHSNAGISPFEVIYGKPIRGPLEVMAESWKEETEKEMNLDEWVCELRKKLEIIREVVQEREKKAWENMKTYDEKIKHKEYGLGALVLTRVPGQKGKLDDKWEGPFEVVRKLGKKNYEVLVNEGRKRRRIGHVNNCKEWKEIESAVLKVIVADEV